jgi:hypothetical protein
MPEGTNQCSGKSIFPVGTEKSPDPARGVADRPQREALGVGDEPEDAMKG